MISAMKWKMTGLRVRFFGRPQEKIMYGIVANGRQDIQKQIDRIDQRIKETDNANAMARYWSERERLCEQLKVVM